MTFKLALVLSLCLVAAMSSPVSAGTQVLYWWMKTKEDLILEKLEDLSKESKEFHSHVKKIYERFDKVDERFDKMDDKMDKRYDKMDKRFDKVDNRLDKMNEHLESLQEAKDDMWYAKFVPQVTGRKARSIFCGLLGGVPGIEKQCRSVGRI